MRGREGERVGGSFVIEEKPMKKISFKRKVGGWMQDTEVKKIFS